MKSGVFEAIRDRVDIAEAAARYGVQIIRGKALCPFHRDKHPSMSFKNGYFRCWACGEHGDVIDLVGKLTGVSVMDAAAQLNSDFALGMDMTQRADQEQVKQWKREKQLVTAFELWEQKAFQTLVAYNHLLEGIVLNRAPMTPDEEWSDEWCAALRERPVINGNLDVFIYGEYADKLEFFKNMRQEVGRIERIIESRSIARTSVG